MDVVECEELLLVGYVAGVGEVQVGQGVQGQGQRGEREGEQDQLLQSGEHCTDSPTHFYYHHHLQGRGHGGPGAAHEAAERRGAQGAGGLQTGQGAWRWKDL